MMDIAPLEILKELFDTAVRSADPMTLIPPLLGPKPAGRLLVIGAGKASARMAEAVESVWGACEGLVITRYGYARPCRGIEIIEAGHPVPDETGVTATRRLLELLEGCGPEVHILALISGGGSALLVCPAGEITLAEKQQITNQLLASGVAIDKINIVRKHLSKVKGGQLAAAAYPAHMRTLMISDVPGDNPAHIASGPTVGDNSTAAEARAILDGIKAKIPPSIEAALAGSSGVLAPGAEALSHTENRVIASPAQSLAAAMKRAQDYGVQVRILGDAIEGEARDIGEQQAKLALDLQHKMKPGDAPLLLLSGGECTVTRRGDGVGGPNAEFLLSAFITLAGAEGIYGLACDTDGVDGAAEVAGALIAPVAWRRAAARGLDVHAFLENNDSHSFFEKLEMQIITGPTLTNVNDFRAFLIYPVA
jgi:hydroxypyruvate reductase